MIVLYRCLSVMAGIGGVLGVYFLTPASYGDPTLFDGARAVLFILVITCVVRAVYAGWKSGNRAYRLLVSAAGIGLLGAILLVAEDSAWSAGKALSYTAPLLCLAIVAPALLEHNPARSSAWLWPIPWIGAQAWFAALALAGLSNPDGVRLPAPYPEIQDLTLKTEIRWDIADQLQRIKDCPVVEIAAGNPFFRQFASIALYETRKKFFYREPVTMYYDTGKYLGNMPDAVASPECRLIQQGRSGAP